MSDGELSKISDEVHIRVATLLYCVITDHVKKETDRDVASELQMPINK